MTKVEKEKNEEVEDVEETIDNLYIYNQIKEVPEKAQKQIKGGRLSGMTDIKPMWRIEKLTEMLEYVVLGGRLLLKIKK